MDLQSLFILSDDPSVSLVCHFQDSLEELLIITSWSLLPIDDCFPTKQLQVAAYVEPLHGEQEQPLFLVNAARWLRRLLLRLLDLLTSFMH